MRYKQASKRERNGMTTAGLIVTRVTGRGRPAILKRVRDSNNKRKRCFTLEINHKPVLVLSESSLSSATKRTSENWFLQELEQMRSNGSPILGARDKRMIRPANPGECAKLELERSLDHVRGEDTKYAFAFLIPIDAVPN